MKRIGKWVAAAVLGCAAGRIASGQELSELSLPPGGNGVSQRSEVSQWIGLVKVTIGYHSPNVHGRGGRPNGPHLGRADPVRPVRRRVRTDGGGPVESRRQRKHDDHVLPRRAGRGKARQGGHVRALPGAAPRAAPGAGSCPTSPAGEATSTTRRTRSRRSRPRRRRLPTRNS